MYVWSCSQRTACLASYAYSHTGVFEFEWFECMHIRAFSEYWFRFQLGYLDTSWEGGGLGAGDHEWRVDCDRGWADTIVHRLTGSQADNHFSPYWNSTVMGLLGFDCVISVLVYAYMYVSNFDWILSGNSCSFTLLLCIAHHWLQLYEYSNALVNDLQQLSFCYPQEQTEQTLSLSHQQRRTILRHITIGGAIRIQLSELHYPLRYTVAFTIVKLLL